MPVYLTGTDDPDVLRAKKSGWGTYWRRWRIVGKGGDDIIYGGGDGDGDWLYGNEGEDTIYGYRGHDYINGGTGKDTMDGGFGNDIFIVDNSLDKVIERAGEGFDTVRSYAEHYVLPANVEKLELKGSALGGYGNDSNNWIYGNDLDNVLMGNGGINYLYGYEGSDWLLSTTGIDYMFGGKGNDTYFIGPESQAGTSVLEFLDEGHDTVNSALEKYTLINSIEDLTLVEGSAAEKGTGNNLDNIIIGNSNDNYLSGREGVDHLHGMVGNDRLYGDAGDDFVYGYEGNDLLYGGLGTDVLVGGDDDDTLVGVGTSARNSREYDEMYGGSGADTFVLGWTSGSISHVHYQGAGFAKLYDFSREEGDKIQAGGNRDAYSLTSGHFNLGSSEVQDTIIKYGSDTIGYVVDNTAVSVATDFSFSA
ncbi:MAG: calcium-binding protein [Cyanobacteria bacterium P01_F01_bin.86]